MSLAIAANEISKLDAGVIALDHALGAWETRDDTRPQPEVRRAANTAMDTIDGMLRDLNAMRERLAGEIRAHDAAAEERRAAQFAAIAASASAKLSDEEKAAIDLWVAETVKLLDEAGYPIGSEAYETIPSDVAGRVIAEAGRRVYPERSAAADERPAAVNRDDEAALA